MFPLPKERVLKNYIMTNSIARLHQCTPHVTHSCNSSRRLLRFPNLMRRKWEFERCGHREWHGLLCFADHDQLLHSSNVSLSLKGVSDFFSPSPLVAVLAPVTLMSSPDSRHPYSSRYQIASSFLLQQFIKGGRQVDQPLSLSIYVVWGHDLDWKLQHCCWLPMSTLS